VEQADDPDGVKEKLLDVSDATVFAPVLVPVSGGGGGTNAPPTAGFSSSCTGLARGTYPVTLTVTVTDAPLAASPGASR
jgi:hypothetical protein